MKTTLLVVSSYDAMQVVWAATGEPIPDQPATSDLREKTLAVEERSIRNLPLGISGKVRSWLTSRLNCLVSSTQMQKQSF